MYISFYQRSYLDPIWNILLGASGTYIPNLPYFGPSPPDRLQIVVCVYHCIIHIMSHTRAFPLPNIYELMWENTVEMEKPRMANIIRRMRFACWVTEATNTNSEYVIIYWFSPATLAECRRLRFTLHLQCLTYLFSLRIFRWLRSR